MCLTRTKTRVKPEIAMAAVGGWVFYLSIYDDAPVWRDVYDTRGAGSLRRHQGSGEGDVEEQIESYVQAIGVRVYTSDVDETFDAITAGGLKDGMTSTFC